jgi:ketosteroid isomerase-like protein
VSQTDIDVVLDQFAATNERDFERAMGHYADEVTLIASQVAGPGKAGTYEGKKAVGEWFGDWFSTFDRDYHFEITEARELPEGPIFLHAKHGGTGRLSGIEVHGENAYLYRVRDGRITRVGFYMTRKEALEAASLPEWSEGEAR